MSAFGITVNPQLFIIYVTGLIALVALAVWLLLYELFRPARRSVAEKAGPLRYYPVMCGWDVDISETPQVGKLVVDILKRSWKHMSPALSKGARAYLHEWYVYAYIVLFALVAAALILGW
jgi:hypothetical protein